MRKINNIVIHCTAGYGSIESIKRFWQEKLRWRSPGYHLIVDLKGKVHNIHPFDRPTNGVKGHNADSLHISYIGGVDRNDYSKAVDTRTKAQKEGLITAIYYAMSIIMREQSEAPIILGHRDFSPDRNGDGIISEWERIKECPSFDAEKEYKWITDAYHV